MTSEIVWFRRDVRVCDNPAWAAATQSDNVVALFVIDPSLYEMVSRRRREYLIGGLRDLDDHLTSLGGRLRVEFGDPRLVVPDVSAEVGAERVHINREVTGFGLDRDREVGRSVELVIHEGTYVHPTESVRTSTGDTYKVFTPFHRRWSQLPTPPEPSPGDAVVAADPGRGLPDEAEPSFPTGERAARQRMEQFLERLSSYRTERDRPDLDTTSRLSIDLKYGWIGPSELVRRVGTDTQDRAAFVRQLAWRDFYAHVMAAHPETADEPMRPEYRAIRWSNEGEDIEAWKKGLTGYPLVDAGMRQLLAEGWVHNRVRLVAASFLVKDLLVDWRIGERWFRRQLLDADTAQNVGNWQWVAGTGADAAPYFRVFNPVTQSRKFDPNGEYIRRWIPELARLADDSIHAPWELRPLELAGCGVTLGVDYPAPVVDHIEARSRTIAAYEAARSRAR